MVTMQSLIYDKLPKKQDAVSPVEPVTKQTAAGCGGEWKKGREIIERWQTGPE